LKRSIEYTKHIKFYNPEIPGLAATQSRHFGIGKTTGIPVLDPEITGLETLDTSGPAIWSAFYQSFDGLVISIWTVSPWIHGQPKCFVRSSGMYCVL